MLWTKTDYAPNRHSACMQSMENSASNYTQQVKPNIMHSCTNRFNVVPREYNVGYILSLATEALLVVLQH